MSRFGGRKRTAPRGTENFLLAAGTNINDVTAYLRSINATLRRNAVVHAASGLQGKKYSIEYACYFILIFSD
jgi:hypothetical protein